MSKNEIRSVPQLMLVEGRHVTQELDSSKKQARALLPMVIVCNVIMQLVK